MFEDEFSALQADMVDICNEYSCEKADKIFIYIAYERMILTQHFYCIKPFALSHFFIAASEDAQEEPVIARPRATVPAGQSFLMSISLRPIPLPSCVQKDSIFFPLKSALSKNVNTACGMVPHQHGYPNTMVS